MNTEQLKTDGEERYVNQIADSLLLYHSRQPIKKLTDFASQESKRAVQEFKEKLKEAVLYEINSNTSSHLLSRSRINDLIDKL